MPNYSFDLDDIRIRFSAEQVAIRYAGSVVVNHRTAATWRGGKNPENVLFNSDGTFKDFKTGDHGGPVALYALIKGMKIAPAAEELGSLVCPQCRREQAPTPETPKSSKPAPASISVKTLPPPAKNRYDELIQQGYKEVATYNYTTVEGKILYTIVRLENGREKAIVQRNPTGWGTKNVDKVLYNLPGIAQSEIVWVAEGEKCAEALIMHGFCGTTATGGATQWNSTYSQSLKGKTVVICADNDEPGRQHALQVASAIQDYAAQVKIITPFVGSVKGDVADYFQTGKSSESLQQLADEAQIWQTYTPGKITPEMKEVAKSLNSIPFSNYEYSQDGGVAKKTPRRLADMIIELHNRFLGFPYKIGGENLFDVDKDTQIPNFLVDQDNLFSWISLKSQNYNWSQGNGYITRREFFKAVLSSATRFEELSITPDYPPRKSSFYLHPAIPTPSEHHQVFSRLLDMFCLASPDYRPLLGTLFAAPLWFVEGQPRPSWIIDSVSGAGVGKTTLAEIVALLYRCTPIDTNTSQLSNHADELIKRLVTASGRKSKIVLLDNLSKTFPTETLASLITAQTISGRAPYSAQEDTRPNNLTYIITANSVQIDNDIASRSYFIYLKRPNYSANWKQELVDYVNSNRWQLFADIIDLIRNPAAFDVQPSTRFPGFEKQILHKMCKNETELSSCVEILQRERESANYEQDDANQFEDGLRDRLGEIPSVEVENDILFVQTPVLKAWGKEILDRNITTNYIINLARNNMLRHVPAIASRFPFSTFDNLRRTGVFWIGEEADYSTVKIVGISHRAYAVISTRPCPSSLCIKPPEQKQ